MRLDELGKKSSSTSMDIITDKKIRPKSPATITNSSNYYDKKSDEPVSIHNYGDSYEDVDDDDDETGSSLPEMCDSACQTRESLFNTDISFPNSNQFESYDLDHDRDQDFDDSEQSSQFRVETLIQMTRNSKDKSFSPSTDNKNSNRTPDIIVMH